MKTSSGSKEFLGQISELFSFKKEIIIKYYSVEDVTATFFGGFSDLHINSGDFDLFGDTLGSNDFILEIGNSHFRAQFNRFGGFSFLCDLLAD